MEGRRQGPALNTKDAPPRIAEPPAPAGETITTAYRSRRDDRQSAATVLERRDARIAAVRLSIAASAVVILFWLGRAGVPWLGLPLLAFLAVAWWHNAVLNALDRARRAVEFYDRGLARIEDRWAGTSETGAAFQDEGHPCAADLDLFGRASLFELLCSPRTRSGEATLAAWLKNPASPAEVEQRQRAARELSSRLDLREDLFVLGPLVRGAIETESLAAWATAPPRLSARWPPLVLASLSMTTTAGIALWIAWAEPPVWLTWSLFAQVLVAGWFRRAVRAVTDGVDRRARELELLATLLARLERERVESPRLKSLLESWSSGGRSASAQIARLARLVEILTSRDNELFRPLAALWCVASQCAFGVERWRAQCGALVPAWIAGIGEYEALAALGGYVGEHPDDVFAEVSEGAPRFEAEGLSHPLLPAAAAVANDVALGGPHAHVLIVSGSNMSGKSTLLRTVGIAAVMAQAGLPVRARRLRMSPLRPAATLRVLDSLQAGRSRFFAEVTRLGEMVAMAKAAQRELAEPVLFLLDEVLSGTNSHDRRVGATAVIRGLIDLGAVGLVTTHDLALTEVAAELGAAARNVHFEDRFEGGTLHFDFRLRDGVVRSSTALPLMRSVGLDV